ncbi:hypothetical protein [Vagococcus hydrophili]|uniref:Uncharacterized protein n=1 Tax=Vagococcus hydrophili TaxID=2714947 RepID=A0A6G8ATN8_9ENTE|nr:hypothetical protein [Vagococcus hydrophili]QIL48357.1 hypothetical protein G7082_07545 [Vagococcus hydrophili]
MCPSCGYGLPSGSGVCPNCKASVSVNNNHSNYYTSTNNSGSISDSAMKLVLLLGVISLVLPIAIINPLSVNHFLMKQRRFPSISETGRKLAYQLSFAYSAWFLVFILVVFESDNQDIINSYLTWLFPIYAIIMVVSFLLLFRNTIKEQFLKKKIDIGILHVIGAALLVIIASIPIPVVLVFKAILMSF